MIELASVPDAKTLGSRDGMPEQAAKLAKVGLRFGRYLNQIRTFTHRSGTN